MSRILLPLLFLVILHACTFKQKQLVKIPTDFTKSETNPILSADSGFVFFDSLKNEKVYWQRADVFNPAAVVKDGKIMLLYRAEDNPKANLGGRTSRIGLAESMDGIHFKKFAEPVLYPRMDGFRQYDFPGGCEDPRVAVTSEGLYVMLYTAWNYDVPRLSVAFSKDLIHWEKKGPAFAKAYGGAFKNKPSKSGSILTKMGEGQPQIKKVNGKYWMYWGEHLVNLAWSENLYDWYPEIDTDSSLVGLINPRQGFFDSNLTECGPPAVWTDEGITLLYNGKNHDNVQLAAAELPPGTYSVGRVIFDLKDLRTVVSRSDKPFLKPTLPHETSGQYKAGTTFAEGLVFFNNKWFLYYGTADSFVGVAVSK